MAKYRKIEQRIWNDEKFRTLSDDGKLVFFLLLTHPHMTAVGAMRGNIYGLASELRWKPERLSEAFREALLKGMAEYDEEASCIALPRFLKYNGPESPNVVKAWASSLDLIPECRLKDTVIQRVKDFVKGLSKGFQEALPEDFAKAMPYQEQEQEQEQEQYTHTPEENTQNGEFTEAGSVCDNYVEKPEEEDEAPDPQESVQLSCKRHLGFCPSLKLAEEWGRCLMGQTQNNAELAELSEKFFAAVKRAGPESPTGYVHKVIRDPEGFIREHPPEKTREQRLEEIKAIAEGRI